MFPILILHATHATLLIPILLLKSLSVAIFNVSMAGATGDDLMVSRTSHQGSRALLFSTDISRHASPRHHIMQAAALHPAADQQSSTRKQGFYPHPHTNISTYNLVSGPCDVTRRQQSSILIRDLATNTTTTCHHINKQIRCGLLNSPTRWFKDIISSV